MSTEPNINFIPSFDPLAKRYDLCNHLFSLGIDRYWRRAVVRLLEPKPTDRVVDLCCGTGDLVFAFAKNSHMKSITGVDISEPMITLAKQKQTHQIKREDAEINWVIADAVDTGLVNGSAEIITCGFGLRNIPDRIAALKEMYRLLASGGRIGILDFSLPANALIHGPYWLYLRYVMPAAGRLVFGSTHPLKYLAESIEQWERWDFENAANQAGLKIDSCISMTFGIVKLHILTCRS